MLGHIGNCLKLSAFLVLLMLCRSVTISYLKLVWKGEEHIYLEVAPAPGLVISHMLRWLLKRVSFDWPQGL